MAEELKKRMKFRGKIFTLFGTYKKQGNAEQDRLAYIRKAYWTRVIRIPNGFALYIRNMKLGA